jgi:hypothetical protein
MQLEIGFDPILLLYPCLKFLLVCLDAEIAIFIDKQMNTTGEIFRFSQVTR